jgi:hypothetical protein
VRGELEEKDAKIVFKIEMEILSKFHINTENGTPRVDILGFSPTIRFIGGHGG